MAAVCVAGGDECSEVSRGLAAYGRRLVTPGSRFVSFDPTPWSACR